MDWKKMSGRCQVRSIPILLFALIIALVVPHVCAENVTYPQEYYTLGTDVNAWMYGNGLHDGGFADVEFQMAELKEIRRQTILLEKNNELVSEQNDLLRNFTQMHYRCVTINPASSFPPYDCYPVTT